MRSLLCLVLITALLANIAPARSETDTIVRILFTNNSNGKLEDCQCRNDPYGGLAERVDLIRSYRKNNSNILFFDSGGYLGLSGIERKGPVVMKLMKEMDYDAWGIGDQELYNGLNRFLTLFGSYSDNIINASLHTMDGKSVFTSHRIFTLAGIRFGVLGIIGPETFRFFPAAHQDFVVEDPDTTLSRLLPVLKNSSDYIIVLSQMGIESDEELAEKWSDIDLIIGGHSQTLLEKPLKISNTHIVQAGKNGGHVGEILLTFDTSRTLKDFSYKLIEVSKKYHIPPDIQIALDEAVKTDVK